MPPARDSAALRSMPPGLQSLHSSLGPHSQTPKETPNLPRINVAPQQISKSLHNPRDPCTQILPTLGPKVCKNYLHWVIWILRVSLPTDPCPLNMKVKPRILNPKAIEATRFRGLFISPEAYGRICLDSS